MPSASTKSQSKVAKHTTKHSKRKPPPETRIIYNGFELTIEDTDPSKNRKADKPEVTVKPPPPPPVITLKDSSDGLKCAISNLEKRIKNMEKKRSKLKSYKAKISEGQTLEKDQQDALTKYADICSHMDFARDYLAYLALIDEEAGKLLKQETVTTKHTRQTEDKMKIQHVLVLQDVLNALGNEEVREDFKSGNRGAVVLTEENLDHLDQLYKLISPTRDEGVDPREYRRNLYKASEHINHLLAASPLKVLTTTYKDLKDLIDLITNCGYLDKVNEPEAADDAPITETTESTEEIDNSAKENVTDNVGDATFSAEVNTEVTDTTPTTDPPNTETPVDPFYPRDTSYPQSTGYTPAPYTTEATRPFQDIISSVKGSFDFLQESAIEDVQDVAQIDPAIVAVHSRASLQQLESAADTPFTTNKDVLRTSTQPNLDYQSNVSFGQNFSQNSSHSNNAKPPPGFRANAGHVTGSAGSRDLNDMSGPPPIPLPNHPDSPPEKKFTMNANAAPFTSMYDASSDDNPEMSPQNDSQEYTGSNSRQYRDGGGSSGNSSRGNRSGSRGGGSNTTAYNSGGSSGGSSGNRGGGDRETANMANKKVWRGYPPREDYKCDYQGYNNDGFNQGYTKSPSLGNTDGRSGANMIRGGGGGGNQRGGSRGSSNRPTGTQ